MEELEQLNFLLESTKEELAGQQAIVATQVQQLSKAQSQLAELRQQMGEEEVPQGV
jgi:DNA repair exonuclease SbcCD ATPase subunit